MALTPNEHGGYVIRQSDLASWSRCQRQKVYYEEAKENPDAPQPQALSATVYGSVLHYALMMLEKLNHAGRTDALNIAIATFEQYWDPANTELLDGVGKIERWLPRQTYGGLRERGRAALEAYYKVLTKEDSKLLALEYPFEVPLRINDRLHTLQGTVDRLSIRKWYGTPYLSIDDYKTGKQPTYLRHHIQGTAYAYASLRPEFWDGFDADTVAGIEHYFARWGYRMHAGTTMDWWQGVAVKRIEPIAARRYRWINLQMVKFADGGWRGLVDYERLVLIVDEYIKTREAGLANYNLTGEVCVYCPFNHVCGGVGVPDEDEGVPPKRYSTKEKKGWG